MFNVAVIVWLLPKILFWNSSDVTQSDVFILVYLNA